MWMHPAAPCRKREKGLRLLAIPLTLFLHECYETCYFSTPMAGC